MLCSGHEELRVAAYCRVSTDKEDQLNSLAAQRSFFHRYITERPGWSLIGVFADEGLSGTSTKHRPQFSEMIQRAMGGEIDLILTKEVSRFARNTVDTLQVTRQLKEKGVGVLFLNDNIDTRENDGEFRLTIMASVAQEESRKISERTRWGQLQAMKRGVVFGNNSLYGYTVDGGQLTVQPEQAQVVRSVYHKFLAEGKGTHVIARELTQAAIRPPLRSDGAWSSTMVLRILRNEKYCGDLLQKKYRTTDYLSHHKILNDGTEEQFCLQDHHEAIVSRKQFEEAQEELARRAGMALNKCRFSARYWYSGKIQCGACGKSFTMKRTRRSNGTEYQRFVCRGHLDGTQACQMRAVRAEVVFACARYVLGQLSLDAASIIDQLLQELQQARQRQACDHESPKRLRQALQRQRDRKDRVLEAFVDGDLSRSDMQRLAARYEEEIRRLQGQLAEIEKKQDELRGMDRCGEIKTLLERELAGGDAVLDEVIQRITVYQDHFLVEVTELPIRFRVCAEGRGAGRGYRIDILECNPIPAES